eukprot:6212935-Pleurochrysis_carterae.AAC.3
MSRCDALYCIAAIHCTVAVCALVAAATRVPIVRGAAIGVIGSTIDRQFDSRVQRLLPACLREDRIVENARAVAMAFTPFAILASTFDGMKSFVVEHERVLLPFVLGWWGVSVQCGDVHPLRDAPRLIAHLLPMRWTGPAEWVSSKVRASYVEIVRLPTRRWLKRRVVSLGTLLRNVTRRMRGINATDTEPAEEEIAARNASSISSAS